MNPKKVAIITGAAGGIGSATASALAEEGFCLSLIDTDAERLAQLNEEWQKHTQTLLLVGDLAEADFLQHIVKSTIETWGQIDVLINNAAWRTLESLRTMQVETWERTLKVCLTAPAFLTKWVAENMEQQGRSGVIVNVSSVMAHRPSGMGPAYIAAKGGLESLTQETAATYGRSGIRVLGIAPGLVETPLSRDYKNDEGNDISQRLIDEMTDFVPLGRGASPQEIAEVIRWAISDSAAYITGTTLPVDGGFHFNFNKYSIKKLQLPNEF